MRNIKYIIVHCSAGNQGAKAADVIHYHTGPKSRKCLGWSAPGYHYFIEADGNIVSMWPEEKISNGCKGVNRESIHVCYAGGVDLNNNLSPIDNRTDAQKESLIKVLKMLKKRYPGGEIRSHRDFASKACPSFDATSEYKDL